MRYKNTRWRSILGFPPTPEFVNIELEVVAQVRMFIPKLAALETKQIVQLWEEFCESRDYEWLFGNTENLNAFAKWCEEEVDS